MNDYLMVDSHCHLSKEDYEDLDSVIEEAIQEKVLMIASSCDKSSQEEALSLAKKYKDKIYLSIGFHPSEINNVEDENIEKLKEIIKENPEIKAIGETGLDYYWKPVDKLAQKELFRKQLKLAEDLKMPVVIHSRSATEDTINTLKEYKVKGVIHCFSGSIETAREYIKLGFYLGIGGIVTFKNSKLKDLIKELGLDSVILETDAPYISPEPLRGKQNRPANVKIVAQKLAEITQLDYDEVLEITRENTCKLFDLD